MLSSVIPSHDIAQWLLDTIRNVIVWFHIPASPTLEQIIYITVISAAAIILGWVLRKVILFFARRVVGLRKSAAGQRLLQQRVFTKCSHIIPPLVFLALIPFAFDKDSPTLDFIRRIIFVYFTVMVGIGVCSIIGFIWASYNARINKDNHPLKGVMNVAKGIVWVIIVIISASILIHRSPMALLGGLGAFAAALMLIFKDSILGLVAGIQLSSNDMLRVGDWIVVPSTLANGIVIDVSLTVVKVQNWDNTIITLPPYTLVSTSFQNWRGMQESGRRQIDRTVLIDTTSIRPADSTLLAEVGSKYPMAKEFIDMSQADGGKLVFNGGVAPVNGTIDTNLGLYRAYLCKYLLNHPAIAHDSNIIVRVMQGDENGTPLDIYCFTNTTEWLAYEAIRSQLIEHISATAPDFGLRIFNATYHGHLTLATPTK